MRELARVSPIDADAWTQEPASTNFFIDLETYITGKQRPLVMLSCGAGRAVARERCTRTPSTRAFNACRNRISPIPIDAFRTTYTYSEHEYTVKLVWRNRAKRSLVDEMVYGKLTKLQLVRSSQVRGWL
jgi:hypothetical protein